MFHRAADDLLQLLFAAGDLGLLVCTGAVIEIAMGDRVRAESDERIGGERFQF